MELKRYLVQKKKANCKCPKPQDWDDFTHILATDWVHAADIVIGMNNGNMKYKFKLKKEFKHG